MKNTLSDLNNYLFEQLERLQDDSLDDAELDREIKRSVNVQKIAKTIIDNGALALEARKYIDEFGQNESVALPMIGITEHKDGGKGHAAQSSLHAGRKRVS